MRDFRQLATTIAIAAVLARPPFGRPHAAVQNPEMLALGVSVAGTLAVGQSAAYRIELHEREFVLLTVVHGDAALTARLEDPDGRELTALRVDNPVMRAGVVAAIAEHGGTYRLVIVRGAAPARSAPYTLSVDVLRTATESDRRRVEAEREIERARIYRAGRPAVYPEAIDVLQHALSTMRQLGERARELSVLLELAGLHAALGDAEELDVARSAQNVARDLGDRAAEAWATKLIAFDESRRGDYDTAAQTLDHAAELCRGIDHPRIEWEILNDQAAVQFRMGRLEQAAAAFQHAAAVARRSGDDPLLIVQNLGVVYRYLGEFDKAFEAYQSVLPAARSGHPELLPGILDNLGTVEHLLHRDREALTHHQEALAVGRASGDKPGQSLSLHTLGETYYALGDFQQALDCFQQAVALRREFLGVETVAASLDGQGRALHRLGQLDAAAAALRESLDLTTKIRDRTGSVGVLTHLAAVERDKGNLPDAIADSRAAVDLEERVRREITTPAFRASFAALGHEHYELLIDLLQRRHALDPSGTDDRDALTVAERARARVLLESLVDSRVELHQGLDPGLADRERRMQRALGDTSTQLSRALAAGTHSSAAETAARKLEELTVEYERLQADIRRTSPRYAEAMQPPLLTTAEIQQQVIDDDSVLLEFSLGADRSWLWAVTRSEVSSVELPPEREIERAARSAYELLTARQPKPHETTDSHVSRVSAAETRLPRALTALSNMLLGRIAGRLNGQWHGKRLVIVAGGALEYFPFSALPVPSAEGRRLETETLADGHELVNAPSASVLAVLRRDASARTRAPKSVAILADPVFEANDPRVRRSGSPGGASMDATRTGPEDPDALIPRGGLVRLPFTRHEADNIRALAGPQSLEALDFRANRATALSGALNNYRIVHFATHGIVDAERPALSGLALSLIDEHGAPQNGYLRLADIYNMNLRADLVVLSGCQTALGKEIKGEGLIGLTRAFMYAGAPRVVASLWEVSDAATSELMRRFYRAMLHDSQPAGAALRTAQLEMKHDPRWRAPYFWAGFVLQGDWK